MLLNVQALRGLAALLVLLFHLQELAERAGAPRDVFVFGNSGVDIFFVISGLIMVFTTARPGSTAGGFLRNRIARVAPLYWLVTLVVFAIAFAAPSLMKATTADPAQLLASLLFVPIRDVAGAVRPTVLVGWTLNYEMAFYLLFAAGMLFPGRRAGLALVLGVLALAGTLGLILQPTGVLSGFYTQPIILEFGAGVILGVALPALPTDRRLAAPAALLMAAALAVMWSGPWLWPQADRVLMYGVPAAIVVACALIMERAGLVLDQRMVQAVGAASYSIYLTHFFLTRLAITVAARTDLHDPLLLTVLAVLCFLAAAVAGVACYRLVELPLTAMAKRGATLIGPRQLKPAT
jgi:peptidoglycan/LPS O-acetylase OafA/YrhL